MGCCQCGFYGEEEDESVLDIPMDELATLRSKVNSDRYIVKCRASSINHAEVCSGIRSGKRLLEFLTDSAKFYARIRESATIPPSDIYVCLTHAEVWDTYKLHYVCCVGDSESANEDYAMALKGWDLWYMTVISRHEHFFYNPNVALSVEKMRIGLPMPVPNRKSFSLKEEIPTRELAQLEKISVPQKNPTDNSDENGPHPETPLLVEE